MFLYVKVEKVTRNNFTFDKFCRIPLELVKQQALEATWHLISLFNHISQTQRFVGYL